MRRALKAHACTRKSAPIRLKVGGSRLHRFDCTCARRHPRQAHDTRARRGQFSAAIRALDAFDLAYLHLMDGLGFGFHKLGEPPCRLAACTASTSSASRRAACTLGP